MMLGFGLGVTKSGGLVGVIPTETTLTFTDPAATVEVDGNRSTRAGPFGIQYVQVPGGGAAINSMTPAETTVSGDRVHGAMLNPQRNTLLSQAQGFDERLAGYVDGLNVRGGSTTLTPDDILLLAVADTGVNMADLAEARGGIVEGYAPLYAVSTLPSADAIPPSPIGWTGRNSFTFEEPDWDAKVALLPDDTVVPVGVTPVTFAQLEPYMILNPIRGLMDSTVADNGYEALSPQGWGGNSATNANYGRYAGIIAAEMAAFLTLPRALASDAQKKTVLQYMAIQGRWSLEAMEGSGFTTFADGGHYRETAIYVETYLWVMDRTAEMDTLADDVTTNQYHQYYKLSAAQKTQFETAHNLTDNPFTSRIRDITAVSGLTIDVNAAADLTEPDSDDVRLRAQGLLMVRVSDGESARVTAVTDNTDETGSYQLTIDVQPSPAFTTSDDVYFLGEDEARAVDTYHYTVKSSTGSNFRFSGMSVEDEYRNFAKDGVLAFFRRALGYYRPVHEALEGYAVQTWDGAFPPLYPWPDPFETINVMDGVSVWAEDFVRENAPDYIPALAPSVNFEGNYFSQVFGTAATFAVDLPAGKWLFTVEAIANSGEIGEAPTELNIASQTVAPFVSGDTVTQSFQRPVVAAFEVTLASAFSGSATLNVGPRRYNNMSARNITGWDVVAGQNGTTFAESIPLTVEAGDTVVVGTAARNDNPTYGAPITTNYTDDNVGGSRAFGGGQGVFTTGGAQSVAVTGIGVSNGRISSYVLLRPSA